MSGRGRGKARTKRHEKAEKGRIGISKTGFKKIGRQAGVKRIALKCIPELQAFVEAFIQYVATRSVVLTDHVKRKTITARDVNQVLKMMGRPLYK
jgi:histone H3/H4